MAQYNIADAKARLSSLVRKALRGDEVVLARDHRPLVKLVPLPRKRKPRAPGSAKGQVWTAPDFGETPSEFDEYAK